MISSEKTLRAIQMMRQTMGTILSEAHFSNESVEQMYLDNICEKLSESFFHEIIKFKRRRNSLSSISRLPPEIFSDIIQLSTCAVWDIDSEPKRYSELSLVSYAWRRAIVADAKLWTNIHLEWTPDVLNMVLARSKGAKLSVRLPLIGSENPICKLESIFASRWNRIEELQIVLNSFRSHSTYLNKFIGQTFPNLRRLTFVGRLLETLNGIPFISDKSSIQTLDLLPCFQEFAINPLIAAFRNVRSLRLNFSDKRLYEVFLQEAHTFTQLEELYLDCDVDDDIWRNDQTPISLPNLNTLLMSGFNMPSIMTRLHTPKLTHYGINASLHTSFEPDWYPIFDSFDYSSIRFLRVEVRYTVDNDPFLHISGCSQQKFPNIYPFYGTSYSRFPKPCRSEFKWFSIRLYDSASDAFFAVLSSLLPRTVSLCNWAFDFYHLQKAAQLESNEDGFHSGHLLSSALYLLEQANTLRHLEISADQEHFVDILNVLCEGSRCPRLETFVFMFANSDEPCDATSEDLTSFVKSRGQIGVPLQLLALENCDPFGNEQCLMYLETLGTRITFNAGRGFMIDTGHW